MHSAPQHFHTRRDTLVFFVCLLLAVALRTLPSGVQQGIASAVNRTVLAPFLALQEQVLLVRASRAGYGRVVAERDSVLVAALEVGALEEENARLRELLDLGRRLPVRYVAAEVLHQAAPGDGLTLVLAAGTRDGVLPMAPVVATGGLLGIVRAVDPAVSVAITWAHPDFRASAMTADGSAFGIVAPRGSAGPGRFLLELRGVPYGRLVPPGTVIYTSGLGGSGGVYPRGLPIGTVRDVADEQEGWARTYVVEPAVQPAAVSHVIVLTGPRVDLRGVFPEIPP